MSASVVQSAKITGSTGTTSTATITAPTVGNTLLVMVTIPTASAPVTTLTDPINGSWGAPDHSGGGLYNSLTCYFFRKSNIQNSPTSLSVTGTTGSFAATFEVVEVSGLDNTSPLVSVKTKTDLSGGSSSATHTASITTSNTSDFVFMMNNSSNSRMLSSADGGYAVIPSEASNSFVHAVYLADAGAAGAKSTLLTYSLTTSALILGVVYKAGRPVVTTTGNTVTEGTQLRFSLSMASDPGAQTDYSAAWGGTAVAGTDYDSDLANATFSAGLSFTGGNIRFASGTTTGTIDVTTYNNALDQDDRTLILTVGGTASTGGTITDNDAVPTISVTDASENAMEVVFTVSLSQASGKSITVDYATANGTKTAGTDYTAASGTLTFAAGETTKTVTVPVL